MEKDKRRYSLRHKIIRYNLMLMISVLILCGFIFVASVGVIAGSYVQSDFEFIMTATADTVESGISYCSDVVTNVRKSEILMNDFLGKNVILPEEKEVLEKEFEKQVSISEQNIFGTGGFPLVEKVYLFHNEGTYMSGTYHVLNYTETRKSDQIFEDIYKKYQSGLNDDGYYEIDEQSICMIFPILDERMEQRGNLFYQIEKSAVEYLMLDVEKYEGAFWVLCDRKGNEICGHNQKYFSEDKDKLLQMFGDEPFEAELSNKSYQIHRKNVGMNLEIFLGIPKNQFLFLLYDSLKVYVIAIALIAAVAGALHVVVIYQMTRPIKEVTDKLTEVSSGKFDTKLPEYDSAEFYEISRVFNEMTTYIEHLIKQVYEKQLSIKDMEMKFLQTQMNPHFMFNVLNTIALQAQMEGNHELHRMISSFNQLIQAKIYRDSSEKVKISQELEYVNYYLYLQNYRFGERLNYKIDIPEERLTQYYIPKLCIQLIVENAVVHGIEPCIGKGFVSVRIYEENQSICIDTEDNGVGFDMEGEILLPLRKENDDKKHNHVGLNNAHHIIRLMYGEAYGIRVFSNPGKGSRICIRIPFDDGGQERGTDEI